tara:strand:- start:197 stop:709 length:513 start_codon:yes stop_codon:yes gene_type:complete
MSRLSKNDIKPFSRRVVNRISVYRQGSWVFASIPKENFTKKTKNQRFYVVNEPFGLCTSRQNNPAKYVDRGNPGDYIASTGTGELLIVRKKDFDLKYPANKPAVAMPMLTSTSYEIEKRKQDVLRKSVNPVTNTLQETYNVDTSGTAIPDANPSLTSTNPPTTTTVTRIY